LAAAADMLVSALRVVPGERFAIVGDTATVEIMAALEHAGLAARAEVASLRLDQLKSHATNHSGDRPHNILERGPQIRLGRLQRRNQAEQ